ncbi:MAG: hypothetical protein J6M44_15125, partial [Butyrivibrio sp.]|nr:hypothetical protein [Butyrivibrio sp.]
MKKTNHHHITTRGLAYALSLMLILSSSNLTSIGSLASEKETTTDVSTEVESVTVSKTITAIDPLDEDIAYQTLKEKGSISDLTFPEELSVTVEKKTTTVTRMVTKTVDAQLDPKEPVDNTDEDESVPDPLDEEDEGKEAADEGSISKPDEDEDDGETADNTEAHKVEGASAEEPVQETPTEVPAEEPVEETPAEQAKPEAGGESSDSARLGIDFTRILDAYVPGTVYAAEEDITDEVK